jgi:hypothetical protein
MKLLFMSLLAIFAKWINGLIFGLDNQFIVYVLVVEEGIFELIVLEFFFLLFIDFSSISRQSLIIKASLFKVLRLCELARVLFLSLLRRNLSRLSD